MSSEKEVEHFWLETVRLVLRAYVHYLPAIAINFIMVEIVAAQVPGMPWLAQIGLFIVFVDFYFGAAARAAGITDENAFWFSMGRNSVFIEPLILLFILVVIVSICFMVVIFQENMLISFTAVAITAVFVVYLLARTWPVWGVSFFYVGKLAWSGSASGYLWQGPGMELALRLTREQGAFNRHTLRSLFAFIVLFGLFSFLRFYLSWQGLSELVLYVIGMPILSMVVVRSTGSLLLLCNVETDYVP